MDTSTLVLTWIGAGLSLALTIYLFAALLFPEKIS